MTFGGASYLRGRERPSPSAERRTSQLRPAELPVKLLGFSILTAYHTSPDHRAMSVTNALKGDAPHQVKSLVRLPCLALSFPQICSATRDSWGRLVASIMSSDTTSCAPTLHSANKCMFSPSSTVNCCGKESNLPRTTSESTQNVAQGMRSARTKTSTTPAGYKSSYRRVYGIYKC